MSWPRSLLLLSLVSSFLPLRANAVPPSSCETPRDAVEMIFGWLDPEHRDESQAARCLEASDRSPQELDLLARRIAQIFEGRDLEPGIAKLPDVADWQDPKSRRSRVIVHAAIPELYVERQADGQWRWPGASLDWVDALHRETLAGRVGGVFDKVPRSLRGTVLGVELWQYMALALLLMAGLLLRKVIQVAVWGRVQRLADRFGQAWATKLVGAIDSPGATLAMAGILALVVPQLHLAVKASVVVSVAVRVIAVSSVVWGAYRLVDVLTEALAYRASLTESKLDDQLVPLVHRSLKVLTVVLGGLFILQNLDVDVGSLLAGLGIGGLAFAFAAKDTLANFFGSVMIFADKPFQIGDWVVVDGSTEGIVEEVGFRSTRVRTFYNSLVTLPNSKIADAKVDNYGARKYRRTVTTLHLTYDTTPEQMQAFVEGIRAIIRANPNTRKDYYEIHFSGFTENSLTVLLYFFFQVNNWTAELGERSKVFLEILRLSRELGITFALPSRRLFHEYVASPGVPREVPLPQPVDQMAAVVNEFGPGGGLARPTGAEITGGWYASQTEETARGRGDGAADEGPKTKTG